MHPIVLEATPGDVESPAADAAAASSELTPKDSTSNAVAQTDAHLGSQPARSAESTTGFSFSRTVWLPQAIDVGAVSAKLADGLLTVSVPKASIAQDTEVQVL
jgi:hypothetical protein